VGDNAPQYTLSWRRRRTNNDVNSGALLEDDNRRAALPLFIIVTRDAWHNILQRTRASRLRLSLARHRASHNIAHISYRASRHRSFSLTPHFPLFALYLAYRITLNKHAYGVQTNSGKRNVSTSRMASISTPSYAELNDAGGSKRERRIVT